jgi:phage-related protein
MSAENLFVSEHITNVSNYSGVYQSGVDYQKFDFVRNADDGLFYYARENITDGGGVYLQDNYRIALVNGVDAKDYIVDVLNRSNEFGAEFKEGQVIRLSGSLGGSDGVYEINQIQTDQTSLNGDTNFTGTFLEVTALDAPGIQETEEEGSNIISISALSLSPTESPLVWAKDEFFFDADYGTTVDFRANNYKYEYGNGYYILQPKNINSLNMEVNLKFKNRTNRETNAIVHFLENHQGQHEQDRVSPNLKYKQGISGFRWDGNATFHPYDSTEVQTKKFFCSEWSHSLNFENSNDVTVKLRNLDASLLQKTSGLFVNPAKEYDDSQFYEKHDVVYSPINQKHYYWSGDSSSYNKSPVEEQANWSRENGYAKDTHQEYWARKFFWKPSIGLSVNQKPRMNEISLGAGYTQIYNDGINESLLNLDLNFNNRSDEEAYAILHFLEQHYGAIPFQFSPPAPYNRERNFVCQEWSHTYNYKNNHSISAKFEEYPFNFDAQQYDNNISPPIESPGELVFTSPAVLKGEGEGGDVSVSDTFIGRVFFKNIGDQAVNISSINLTSDQPDYEAYVNSYGDLLTYYNEGRPWDHDQDGENENANDVPKAVFGEQHWQYFGKKEGREVTYPYPTDEFRILGSSSVSVPIVGPNLSASDYVFSLPVDSSLGILEGKTIRLGKKYKPGSEGGYTFTYIGESITGLQSGSRFIQFNNGTIRSLTDRDFAINTKIFVSESFIVKNATSTIDGGEEGFCEIAFKGVDENSIIDFLVDNLGQNIVTNNVEPIEIMANNRYYVARLNVSSDSIYGTQDGEVKIYIGV